MTLLISAQDLSKSYGIDSLFNHISFTVYDNERLGLIGPNGSGKSTLLKIMMGLETPDQGKITQNKSAHIVYVAQEDNFQAEQTIGDILLAEPYQIREITEEPLLQNLSQKVGTLSGGWRKRLAIVQALLKNPDLLLMDEPTNHLDLEGILWLESLLKKSSFAFVLVTHDRYFLQNTTNAVMELNKVYLDGYLKSVGNYTEFLEKREDLLQGQMSREQSLANKMRREQEWLQQNPKARSTKAQYRIDNAERLKSELHKISSSNAATRTASIDFDSTDRKTKILIEAQQLKISRNHKTLFDRLDLMLSPGTCLGLLGRNGSGKSTLLNLLNGNLEPDAGKVERAPNLRIVTFDQKREQLDQNQTLMHALAPDGDSVFYKGKPIHVAAWASRFLFPSDQLRQSVSKLSGGEQARVLIAKLMLEPADILLLDEPTNDLDIPTLEVLENNLLDFPGAIVLITHDRFLLDRLSDRLLYLDGQGHAEYFADYHQWLQSVKHNTAPTPILTEKIKKPKQLTYEEQKELSRIESKIQKAESDLEALQHQLVDPLIAADPKKITDLCTNIQTLKEKIEQTYKRWAELENRKNQT